MRGFHLCAAVARGFWTVARVLSEVLTVSFRSRRLILQCGALVTRVDVLTGQRLKASLSVLSNSSVQTSIGSRLKSRSAFLSSASLY